MNPNHDVPIVLKFGGSNFHPEALDPFAQAVAWFRDEDRRLLIVHGGGKDLTQLLERLGAKARFVDGHRVTDAETLDAAELVLSGRVNKRITRALMRAGVKAVGIAGTDGGLLAARVRKAVRRDAEDRLVTVDLGHVGDIERVDTALLEALATGGFVPVISPLAVGPDGEALNVNADAAAAALAAALGAEMRLVTNVPGILNGGGRPLPHVSAADVDGLKADGVIRDGMIPKVDACVDAVRAGAPRAVIQSLDAFLAGQHVGTSITAE